MCLTFNQFYCYRPFDNDEYCWKKTRFHIIIIGCTFILHFVESHDQIKSNQRYQIIFSTFFFSVCLFPLLFHSGQLATCVCIYINLMLFYSDDLATMLFTSEKLVQTDNGDTKFRIIQRLTSNKCLSDNLHVWGDMCTLCTGK